MIINRNSIIPVFKYGGTQRDIYAQGKELAKLGHKVSYLVKKGSNCPFGEIIAYDPQKTLDEQIPIDTDIVHFHDRPDETIKKPYIVTVHGNGKPGETYDINAVFVSKNHAYRHNSKRYVYNGLDFDLLGKPNLDHPRKHLLFLAKASRKIKNLKGSIEITKKAGKKLAVVGGKKLNIDPQIKYYGMLGGEEKNRMIQNSEALLFPVLWHEPLGLAILESLYFGCPVFGTPFGSLPELISSELGFISNSKSELTEAIKNSGSYDPVKCHQFVADNFSARKMTENYLQLFEEVLNGHDLNPVQPSSMITEKEPLFKMQP
ncbi:MAG: glycosyltransferase [Bacteroidales bacterium]|nr:glycosyltransferase [Bacteroidales bacterium]